MTKATVLKLAVLIFLAFIVCLPEFFPSETVLQLHFLCSPFDLCDPVNGCLLENEEIIKVHRKASEVAPKNATNQSKAVEDWFMCQTEADLDGLINNSSVSGTDMEVILSLQTADPPLKNVTVQAYFNHSRLYIESKHNITLFSCNKTKLKKDMSNPNAVSHSVSAFDLRHQSNRSYWILHFQNISKTPGTSARWWGVGAIVWLILVLVVLLLVFLSIGFKVQCRLQKKQVKVPANIPRPVRFSERRVKSLGDLPDSISILNTEARDEELFLEKILISHSRESHLQMFVDPFIRGLSPIREVSVTGSAVSLNIPTTPVPSHNDPFIFLHHRGHPSTVDSVT